jgi:hypothetical protein
MMFIDELGLVSSVANLDMYFNNSKTIKWDY